MGGSGTLEIQQRDLPCPGTISEELRRIAGYPHDYCPSIEGKSEYFRSTLLQFFNKAISFSRAYVFGIGSISLASFIGGVTISALSPSNINSIGNYLAVLLLPAVFFDHMVQFCFDIVTVRAPFARLRGHMMACYSISKGNHWEPTQGAWWITGFLCVLLCNSIPFVLTIIWPRVEYYLCQWGGFVCSSVCLVLVYMLLKFIIFIKSHLGEVARQVDPSMFRKVMLEKMGTSSMGILSWLLICVAFRGALLFLDWYSYASLIVGLVMLLLAIIIGYTEHKQGLSFPRAGKLTNPIRSNRNQWKHGAPWLQANSQPACVFLRLQCIKYTACFTLVLGSPTSVAHAINITNASLSDPSKLIHEAPGRPAHEDGLVQQQNVASPPLSVAVAIAGELRVLAELVVQVHLKDTFSSVAAEFFLDVSRFVTPGLYKYEHYNATATDAQITSLSSILAPAFMTISSGVAQTSFPGSRNKTMNYAHFTNTYLRRARLIAEIELYEAQTSRRFDVVFATRPDMWYGDTGTRSAAYMTRVVQRAAQSPRTVFYAWDFVHVMARDAATHVMRFTQQPSTCNMTKLISQEMCVVTWAASELGLSHHGLPVMSLTASKPDWGEVHFALIRLLTQIPENYRSIDYSLPGAPPQRGGMWSEGATYRATNEYDYLSAINSQLPERNQFPAQSIPDAINSQRNSQRNNSQRCDNPITANVVCSSFTLPKVAFCLAGASRTFQQPLLYRSIRTNLIEAFGGEPTIFAILKLEDDRGDRRPRFGGLVRSSRDAVMIALHHIGVKRDEHTILSSEKMLPNRRYPVCGRPDYAKVGRSRDLYDSLVGQLNSRHACHDLISAEEARIGAIFNYVIYARPDLSWPIAVRPFCHWDLKRSNKKTDWLLFMNRDDARRNLESLAQEMWTCARVPRQDRRNGIQLPEFYMAEAWKGGNSLQYSASGFLTRQDQSAMPGQVCNPRDWIGNRGICPRLSYLNPCANQGD